VKIDQNAYWAFKYIYYKASIYPHWLIPKITALHLHGR
jgi:hypothetical protein